MAAQEREDRRQVAGPALEQALGLLGPLEAKIMRAVWTGAVPEPFLVRSVQPIAPELAYTTLMTTLNRLADKGLLEVEHTRGRRAYEYRAAGTPAEYLVAASRRQFRRILDRFGEAALAAFAAELGELTAEQRERLRTLAGDE
jgi:predicted transcriptional regulator